MKQGYYHEYTEVLQFDKKKRTNGIKKWAKAFYRNFQISNKH